MGPKINLLQNSCRKIVFNITLGDAVIKSVTDNGEEMTYSSKYIITDIIGMTHTIIVTDFNDEYDTLTVKVEGHNFELYQKEEPICKTDGTNRYKCTICEETYSEKVKATGHHYDIFSKVKPTCTEKGYTIYRCPACQNTYHDDFIDALGHTNETIRIEPTCTIDGSITTGCTRCHENTVKILPKLGHNWVMIEGTESTYENDGHGIFECTRCHERKSETIPKKEFGIGNEINLAKCPIYSTPYSNYVEGYATGKYYQWYEREVNNRIKIACHKEHCATAGMIVGWIDKYYIDRVLELQEDIFFKMGDAISISYGTVYDTHSADKGNSIRNGIYYISGNKIVNKRIPITDNPDSIGYEGHWVGWLDLNKITIAPVEIFE
ncbi:MAG: hypothetical protein NC131_14280 [Roseburia sp.]|nr:hypothetical protein [Roseburia sp.]